MSEHGKIMGKGMRLLEMRDLKEDFVARSCAGVERGGEDSPVRGEILQFKMDGWCGALRI
jgi:hypothetical protein